MTGPAAPLLLGIDVGGTFTDVIVRDDRTGAILVDKVPSTPADQSIGVIDAIRRLRDLHGLDLHELRLFSHGSTVATNALLELKLPPTVLIVTEGFRDVLEIADQKRPGMFNLTLPKPAPLVRREQVFEAHERVDRLGNIVASLEEAEIERIVGVVKESGAQACAVSFLFSFQNGDHERRLRDALLASVPGLDVAISSEVAPEIGEYPRTSTTVICASVQPLVAHYVEGIQKGLDTENVRCPLFIMQSSGGVLSAREASSHAHRMLLSGPAAGVLGAAELATASGYADQITFDMGGTSTDICLIHDGRPALAREPEFDGRPLRVPQLDIHTIGSGGGSIAWVSAGLLHVGPQSAGAQPGPACYGRGGTEPTVTDAHVVLGRVDPDHFLGGEMTLDPEASRVAVGRLAAPLGLSLEDAAIGILEIAEAQMARGVRVVSVNRGFDPRSFTLVAFGGAGPMHAFGVGRLVDVGAVLVPTTPGAFSALGLVNADVKYDLVRIVGKPVAGLDGPAVEELAQPLLAEAGARLAALGEHNLRPRLVRTARFRYAWQENDVEVVIGDEPISNAAFAAAIARFHELHDFEFGYSNPEDQVELIAVCLEAYGALPRTAAAVAPAATGVAPEPSRVRQACFRGRGWVETAVYERASLPAGAELRGPAVIEEREATTVVPPGAALLVDRQLNLVLTAEEAP